jgi:hypothetical protein
MDVQSIINKRIDMIRVEKNGNHTWARLQNSTNAIDNNPTL